MVDKMNETKWNCDDNCYLGLMCVGYASYERMYYVQYAAADNLHCYACFTLRGIDVQY